MKKISLKLLAMLLIAAMLCSMFPVAFAAEEGPANQEISKKAEAIIEADIWNKIDQFEDDNIIETKDAPVSVEDYAELSDEIESLVKQSETYVEGTVVRNGDFFTWETSEGIVCGYSPELRYRTRNLSETGNDNTTVENFGTKAAPSDKDVFLIAPYYGYDSSFTNQYKNEASSIASATGGKYTLYEGTNATITNIANAMQNGGVVIFDSHGITDYQNGDDYVSRANSSYLCLKSSTGITSTDMKAVSGTYGTYYHAFNGGSAYCVDGTAIKNHMSKSAPGTILWMAICLGMATNGLCTPMRNAGVEVVYGYSQSVSFTGDYKYETYFWNKMKAGSDVKTAISYMKSASGSNWDPAYANYSLSQAKSYYVAFPIVVSDQDSYPGQGKVDAVQTVYSTYKLIDNSGSTTPTTPPTTAPDDGGSVETYTYNLVTSASNLTAGEYIIITVGSDGGYYALSTTQDSEYSCMQSIKVGLSSVATAITCDSTSVPSFAFNLKGNANGFTLSNSNGSLNAYSGSDGVGLYYGTASTWTGTYNSSSKGFTLKSGSTYMSLRDDAGVNGDNGYPIFAITGSTSTGSTLMHMYKRENAGTCSHSSTSTTTTPATCTTPGANVVTCNACGTVVSNTAIPATGHNISYTSNGNGTHKLYCSNCKASDTADCTYTNNVCKYCGYTNSSSSTETTSDRYVLVTSAGGLTAGEYLIMATATGSYAGDYGYYIMTTTADTDYSAMQSGGLNFDSLPGALLLDTSATSKYVWTFNGNANSFTIKSGNGALEGGVSGSNVYLKYGTASTWKGTYNSSNKGFILNNGTVNLVFRDDISATGTNGAPLFVVDPSTNTTVYMHLYKKDTGETQCSHSNTSTSVISASCTEDGETIVTCDDCGEIVETSVIPATGHNIKTTTTAATCTTAGKTVEYCTICGTTIKTTTIPATGHTSKTTTTPATCTTAGKTVETCTTCGTTIKTTTIPATGHSTKTTTVPATCTEDGETVETCKTCGEVVKTTTIPATGHSIKTTTTPATCTTAGKTVETCTTCGTTIKTTTISALGHDETYTANGDGTHMVGCSRCDVQETADCVLEENTCIYCGYKVEEELPEIPEPSEDPEPSENPEIPEIPEEPEISDLTPGKYVIAAYVDGTYYGMSNAFANKITGTTVSVVDGKISAEDAEGYVVILEQTEDGWTIEGADGTYLKYGSSTNLGKSAEPYAWTITEGTNGTWRVAAQTAGRGLVFRAKSYNQFGGYAVSNCTEGSAEYFDIELIPVGEEEPAEPFAVTIRHTLNIASDISINYAVAVEELDGYEGFYLKCEIPTYVDNVLTGYETLVIDPVANGDYYYFTLNGVTAPRINDEIRSTLYAYKDGAEYVSDTDLYSIAIYAYNQMEKPAATEKLKNVCAELLRYGAKAQIFKEYRTDALADAQMTAEQIARLTDLETVKFGNCDKVLDDITDPVITWAGKALILDTKVTLRFVANLTNYTGAVEDLTVQLSYITFEGTEATATLSNAVVYNASKNYYAFDFDGLRVADLRTVVSAAVYGNGEQLSPTMQYSMDTYGNGKTGNLLVLSRALVAYADAAKNYFVS